MRRGHDRGAPGDRVYAVLLLVLACVPGPAPAPPDRIPADDATIDALDGWSANPTAYGLTSAAELSQRVRLRRGLLGRLRAMVARVGGDAAGCAAAYREAYDAVGTAQDAPTRAMRDALATGAAVCDILSRGADAQPDAQAPEEPRSSTPWVRWARIAANPSPTADAERTDALKAAARAVESPAPVGSDAAWQAWAQALDPLLPSETLTSWSGAEPRARDAAMAEALRAANGTQVDLLAPSRRLGSEAVPFDVAGLGAVPGADTLADLAHLPFPRPVRRLARMDVGDPAHRAYLGVQATHLNSLGAPDVPVDVEALATRYDRMGHTTRWYNRTALRQAAARNLAGRGAWRQAARVLEAEATVTGPGWRVLARDSDVRALQAALLLRAGDSARAADMVTAAERALTRFEVAIAGR
jgi:hypothetical protein